MAIVALVALSIGIVAGVYGAQRPGPDTASARQGAEPETDAEVVAGLESRIARRDSENASLSEYAESLEQELAALKAADPPGTQAANEGRTRAPIQRMASPREPGAALVEAAKREAIRQIEEEAAAKKVQKAERKADQLALQQERKIQRRERLDDYVDAQYARASDPATKDRLASIANYQVYFDDLVDQFKFAETEEEIQAIMDALRDGQLEQRDLIWDQQRAMIAEAANNNGLTDPEAQAQLANQIIRTLNSPFFSQRGAFLGAKPLID